MLLLGVIHFLAVRKLWITTATVAANLLIVAFAAYLAYRRSNSRAPKVCVFVIAPSGAKYRVEVHPEADDHTILARLLPKLGLPRVTQDGQGVEYAIDTTGARSVREGAVIRIEQSLT
jgi:hypothetical protein